MARLKQSDVKPLLKSPKEYHRDDEVPHFYLRVQQQKSGPKGSWVVKGMVNGRIAVVTIGNASLIPLKEARLLAVPMAAKISSGVDPRDEIQQQKQQIKKAQALEKAKRFTLASLLEDFLRVSAHKHKAKTQTEYRLSIRRHLQNWLDKPAKDLSEDHVEELFLSLQHAGKKSEADAFLRYGKAVFNYGLKLKHEGNYILTANPFNVITTKRLRDRPRPKERYLSARERKAIYEWMSHWHFCKQSGESDAPYRISAEELRIFEFFLHTGLRRQEALSLKWEHVYPDHISIEDTKNKHPHELPLSSTTKRILDQQLAFIGPDCEWVWPDASREGHRSEPRAIWRKISRAAKIKHFTAHDLRRTFGTVCAELGTSELMISRALNHAKRTVTGGYIQTSLDLLLPVFAELTKRLEGEYSEVNYPELMQPDPLDDMSEEDLKDFAQSIRDSKNDTKTLDVF